MQGVLTSAVSGCFEGYLESCRATLSLHSNTPAECAIPLNLLLSTEAFNASFTAGCGGRFPNTAGSPDKKVIQNQLPRGPYMQPVAIYRGWDAGCY